MENKYLLNEAAKLAGVRGYQIAYAITQRYIDAPKETINRQRIFLDEDVARIKQYFANRDRKMTTQEQKEDKQ